MSRPDRSNETSITHVGVGAFARAHLGPYLDDLVHRGHRALWRGLSLHSNDVADALAAQDCYYTVAEREPGSSPVLALIGSLTAVSSGAGAAQDALTVPSTQLVTLTITEKGYDELGDDAGPSELLATAPGALARALSWWRDAALQPPVVAPLDNVADNGAVLRARVGEAADRLDPGLREWIETEVPFRSSVVDRMVPAPTEQDLESIEAQLGLVDEAAVATERHRSWVVEADERLAFLADAGVELVHDVAPFEQRKLWLLNGPHSALAYCGLLVGCSTIADAAADASVSRFVRSLVDDVLAVSLLPATLTPDDFAADALRRFANPYLGHSCAQVAADGSRKLPQRFGAVVEARRRRGLDTERLAAVVALWIAAAAGLEVRGKRLPEIAEPDSTRLGATGRDLRRVAHVALGGRFDDAFIGETARMLGRLVAEGKGLVESLA